MSSCMQPRMARTSAAQVLVDAAQAALMTEFRTLKLRGLDPIRSVTDALRTYVQTGALAPLPQASVARG